MKRIGLVLVLCGVAVAAQVQVHIPKAHYAQHGIIDVVITNTGKNVVSFCVEYGHASFRDANNVEPTPTPLYVQRQTNRGWDTLLNGPDVGSMRHSVVLSPGESQHYPFRLSDRGRMRAVLDYWHGQNDATCGNPKGRHTVRSQPFVID